MAEFVDRRLERGVGELEQLVRVGIFSNDELRAIIAKRQKLEYSVQRFDKTVDDHLKFVQYETNLLDLIAIRRKRLAYDFKFNDIEGSIGRRCHRRLLKAESRYPDHMEIWKLHIDLCKRLKWNAIASQVFTRMLQIHADKPAVWIEAARFELEDNGSSDNARELCLKSLRWHENDENLWRNHLQVELRIAGKIYERAKILGIPVQDDDPITNGKVAVVVISNALKAVKNLDFATSLYEMIFTTQKRDNLPEKLCEPVRNGLLSKMEEVFSSDVSFWKRRAQFFLVPLKVSPIESTEHDIINAEKNAFQVLDDAVEKFDNDKGIWKNYIEFIEELYASTSSDEFKELQRNRFVLSLSVFQRAEESGSLEFEQYLVWANITVKQRHFTDAKSILTKAIALGPRNLDDLISLVSLCQRVTIEKDTLRAILQKGKLQFKEKDVEFWKLYLTWVQENDPENLQSTFQEGLRQSRAVAGFVVIRYLEWAYQTGGVKNGREVLEKARLFPGTFNEATVKLIIAEEMKLNSPVSYLRTVFDNALSVLGTESVDLWIDYIQLETNYKSGNPMNVSHIYWKAQRTLKPNLVNLFISTHALMQNAEADSVR